MRRSLGSRIACAVVLAAALTLVATVALAANPIAGARYSGKLTQATSETVTFKVNAAGTKVLNVKVKPFIPNKCGAGGTPPPEVSEPAAVKRGRFVATVKEELSNGLVSGTATVTGRFLAGGKEKGVIKVPLPEAPECGGSFAYTTVAKH
jgi:hypothetical protein